MDGEDQHKGSSSQSFSFAFLQVGGRPESLVAPTGANAISSCFFGFFQHVRFFLPGSEVAALHQDQCERDFYSMQLRLTCNKLVSQ